MIDNEDELIEAVEALQRRVEVLEQEMRHLRQMARDGELDDLIEEDDEF